MILGKHGLLYGALLLPLAFDFRGESGGGTWQIAVTLATLLAGAVLIARSGVMRPRGALSQITATSLAVALAGAVITCTINGVPVEAAGRAIVPMLLATMGFIVAVSATMKGRDAALLRALEICCAVSAAFSVIAGFELSGVSASDIRYQILSPAILMYQALLLHRILIQKRRVKSAVLLLAATIAIELVSATRSNIAALFVLIAAANWIAASSVRKFVFTTNKTFVLVIAVGLLSIAAASVVNPDIVERWTVRIFSYQQHGADITSLGRVAEIEYQLKQWGTSPTSILIGKGYGATYGLADEAYRVLTVVIGNAANFESNALGHNFFVYSLFAGGLLFGTALPICLLYATWRGLRAARKSLRHMPGERLASNLAAGTLVLVAGFGQMIGGNPFGPRYSGLVLGLALGLVVASHRLYITALAAHRHQLQPEPAFHRGQSSISDRRLPRSQP